MSSRAASATALGAGARVEGDLHLDHAATLAGEVTGSVHTTDHLHLAADAVVHGDIHASSLTVAGRVAGNVAVQHTTELQLGGVIEGGLDTGHFVAKEGASYEGQLRLRRPAAATAPSEESQAPPSFSLNRSAQRTSVDSNSADANPTPAEPSTGGSFREIPGAVNAGLRRRRRRVPHAS